MKSKLNYEDIDSPNLEILLRTISYNIIEEDKVLINYISNIITLVWTYTYLSTASEQTSLHYYLPRNRNQFSLHLAYYISDIAKRIQFCINSEDWLAYSLKNFYEKLLEIFNTHYRSKIRVLDAGMGDTFLPQVQLSCNSCRP